MRIVLFSEKKYKFQGNVISSFSRLFIVSIIFFLSISSKSGHGHIPCCGIIPAFTLGVYRGWGGFLILQIKVEGEEKILCGKRRIDFDSFQRSERRRRRYDGFVFHRVFTSAIT